MISDKRLRQAAKIANKTLADVFPDPKDCQYTFSSSFERKMHKVLRRGNHPSIYRSLRRIASFLLVLLITSSIWLGVDAEAREAFFGWVSERIKDAQHYFFGGYETSETGSVYYTLSGIPDGYQEDDTFETENYTEITYINKAMDQYLSFGYLYNGTNTATHDIFFRMSNMEKELVTVNGISADFYVDISEKTGNLIVWTDPETDTLLYISGFFDKNPLIYMAETVERDNK